MTSLSALSETLQKMYLLWGFVLCIFVMASLLYAVSQKRRRTEVSLAVLLVLTYLAWQILLGLNRPNEPEKAAFFTQLPWFLWAAGFTAATMAAGFAFLRGIRYGKMHITPGAIRLCADRISCGICYWRDNGRVILSNRCMNTLCLALTGYPLLNGNHLRQALPDGYWTLDGRNWRFTCRDTVLNGLPVHEIIASDVTETYQKTETLRKENEELTRMNQELQEHRLRIAETVRKQEILQAKVNIHDEMNRLMLRTVAAGSADKQALTAILSLWRRNALLLCKEAEADKLAVEKCEQLAVQMGICLIWSENLPEQLNETQKDLFFSALREAIINAVKHAEAETLRVTFSGDSSGVTCTFENGGKVSENVHFTGGLANLALLAEEQGAQVRAEVQVNADSAEAAAQSDADSDDPAPQRTFRLSLSFPQKDEK